MRNPTNYNLKEGSFTGKDIDRIYNTLRRRARAAFKHQWSTVSGKENFIAKKLQDNAQAIEYGLTASWEAARKWADRSMEIVRFSTTDLEKVRWAGAQKLVNDSKHLIKNYEAECFQRVRGQRYIKTLKTKPLEDTWLSQVKVFMTRLSMAYPYVSKKNRHRLATALRRLVLSVVGTKTTLSLRGVEPKQLLEFGIPAAEIAGPWWTRTKDIKRPMDWVTRGIVSDRDLGKAYSSPRAADWVESLGLDGGDGTLVRSIENYYQQHKAAPSVEWARRRSNELEEERTKKDMEEQIPKVEEWLDASEYWRRSADYADITIPEMPDPTFRVLRPGDAELLCRAAKRDGLCVVDAVIGLLEDSESRGYKAIPDEDDEETLARILYEASCKENFVTLIISTDPKRRTVVGLNSEGICSSEHHCTGIQNKVDKIAYEYFHHPH